ncbi:FeoA family protein [Thiorhodococcus drewsii AZ1]|uniref:FeoA family protein n=1 Tax=Thiorhodococcus drewsii AZ1 TaxID=765913 RepID=G2E1H0_9GAMM|nr:FeoA family protein [Thiorhodococcus drewsii]EGV31267.1 FeoA family protein [Thiorhodococcus drewsii AZ1]
MSQSIALHINDLDTDVSRDTLTTPSSPARTDVDKPFPLMMASDGEQVRIQSLLGGKGLVMRLTELGLNQGTELRIIQRQGGGLVVARGEIRIALGGGMATKILVTAIGGQR